MGANKSGSTTYKMKERSFNNWKLFCGITCPKNVIIVKPSYVAQIPQKGIFEFRSAVGTLREDSFYGPAAEQEGPHRVLKRMGTQKKKLNYLSGIFKKTVNLMEFSREGFLIILFWQNSKDEILFSHRLC